MNERELGLLVFFTGFCILLGYFGPHWILGLLAFLAPFRLKLKTKKKLGPNHVQRMISEAKTWHLNEDKAA